MQNRITLIAALILISCAFAFGTDMVVNNGYDPGAMRKNASNADSPVFPGPVTVNGVFTASDSAVIGTSTAQAGYDLTVASGAYLMGPVVANGPLTVGVGTTAKPSASFEGDDNTGLYSPLAGRVGIVCNGSEVMLFTAGYIAPAKDFGGPNTGNPFMRFVAAGATTPAFSYTGNTNSGLGRFQVGEPSMVASGTEAMRWTATGTIALVPLLVGTTTQALGYALTVGGTASDSIYCGGDVNALSFTDRSDAPESLAEAYAIIQSHEAKDGKVDHSKLHAAAWGKKFRVVETGKTIVKTREIAPAEEGGKSTIEEYSEPEKIVVSEPDQQSRNLSMVISAQALVIADLTRRLEALEAR